MLRFRDDVDDIFAHGMSALDDGKREEKARKEPTEREREEIRCSCGYVMLARQTVCPGCGKERSVRALVETLPGEMVELTRTQKKHNAEDWDHKRMWMAALKSYANQRGYKPGWAAMKYRDRYGVWPNDPRVKHVEPGPITPEVAGWIKSSLIRFAKARKAA